MSASVSRYIRYLTTSSFLFVLPVLSFAEADVSDALPIEIGLWSLAPAVIAIVLALIFREVISSLIIGIIVGAIILSMNNGDGFWYGILLYLPLELRNALADSDHMSVILFSLLIGATVHVVSKNGGMMAVVKRIAKNADDSRSGQLATYILGIMIFFDDYANTMVVGNTMKPVTDRLKVSREKLAYIVDSTAAPIAAIAFITTWIGAEFGYIQDGLNQIEVGGLEVGSAYGVFLSSLGYSFYPIFTLFFMFLLIVMRRDYGPMYKAEQRARMASSDAGSTSPAEVDAVPDEKESIWNALIPIAVIVIGTVWGLFYTGLQEVSWDNNLSLGSNLSAVIGESDSYKSLVWASFSGLAVAVLMTVLRGIHKFTDTIEHAFDGMKFMLPALAILGLAWTLAGLIEDLNTAEYLAGLIGESFAPQLLPAIVFVMSGVIAFSTGTSWGTMAILYPLVLLTSWDISIASGLSQVEAYGIFTNIVSGVLAGSVLGDHCSPISDTTILSSMATGCDHVAHVKTQLPYALTVGAVALFIGTLPSAYGIPTWILFLVGAIVLYFIVSYFGKMPENADTRAD